MGDLFGYPHAPGARDRDTSRAAAEEVAPTAQALRDRALDVLEHSRGLTADQVAARMGANILSIRPRITELSRLGKIRDSGERRPNKSGRGAIVWTPVYPAALAGQRVAS